MIRISFDELFETFRKVLVRAGFAIDRAELVARLFAENQRDGVYSHGLNRFPGFLDGVKAKGIDVEATPERVESLGAVERWDGKMGVGLFNAFFSMRRAVELARSQGIGCVGLRNTNHWMRGGAYGIQAADAGCIGICWTNTQPLMPPWGSAEVKIGNNPMAIAIPRTEGHILLDMAMSQYSNGKLEVLSGQGKELPQPGGYDNDGNLTLNPREILDSRRALPIGFWKGSGLAFVLDILASVISGGLSTHQIGKQGDEHAVSQSFIAIDVTSLMGEKVLNEALDSIIQDFHSASSGEEEVRYPGEGMLRIRRESLEKGVLVDEGQWQELQKLADGA